jgi:hypothetical protein
LIHSGGIHKHSGAVTSGIVSGGDLEKLMRREREKHEVRAAAADHAFGHRSRSRPGHGTAHTVTLLQPLTVGTKLAVVRSLLSSS